MRITLITACRNAKETLPTALESVARQSLSSGIELEHIVVDGASTDGSPSLLADWENHLRAASRPGLSFRFVSETDRGLYDAINKGIRLATGDIVGILNADDVLASDTVISQISAAFSEPTDSQTTPLQAIYADIRFVRNVSGDLATLRAAPSARYCTGRFFRLWQFRFATFPAHPSTFIRRACFEKYGLYSVDYRISADFEMILRLFWKHRLNTRYLPLCTTVMRMGGLSTSSWRSNLQINREDLRALRTHGYWSCLPLIYLKYLFKIWGFLRRDKGAAR